MAEFVLRASFDSRAYSSLHIFSIFVFSVYVVFQIYYNNFFLNDSVFI